jgi:hypothetical protein
MRQPRYVSIPALRDLREPGFDPARSTGASACLDIGCEAD